MPPQGLPGTEPTNSASYSLTASSSITHTFPASGVDFSDGNGALRIHPSSSTQLNLLEGLIQVGTRLANNLNVEDVLDVETLLKWVGTNANKSALKAFFSHNDAVVATIWKRLAILLSRKHPGIPEARDTFQNLVEIAFETHHGQWIREELSSLIWVVARIGSPIDHRISERLLSRDLIRDVSEIISDDTLDRGSKRNERIRNNMLLHQIAENLDDDMMDLFLRAGIFFRKDGPCYGVWFLSDHGRAVSQIDHHIDLLVKAGFEVDHAKCRFDDSFRGTFTSYDVYYGQAEHPWVEHPRTTLSYLDLLWIEGKFVVYDIMVSHSNREKTSITLPGLLDPARKGIENLKKYLESKGDYAHGEDRRFMLEYALFVAAEKGDSIAIRSLAQAGVDPNIPDFLSSIDQNVDKMNYHPLMRASGRKHLNAFQTLIEIGADPTFESSSPNYLSAAIWQNKNLLSDSKRQERNELVRYLLDNHFVSDGHVDMAVVEAVCPRSAFDKYERFAPDELDPDEFTPDEYVFDMLLQLGNGIHLELGGRNLMHVAIAHDCNLRTVKFLHSRGIQIHSRPDENGETMLHSAAASRSRDAFAIVEFLLDAGASCTEEWGGNTILESALDGPWRYRATKLAMFSFLLKKGAQINYPRRRKKRHVSVLARLLQHNASDELILDAIWSGADIHSPDINRLGMPSYTPLQCAACKGRVVVARQLLVKGADVNAPGMGPAGVTALECAIRSESEALILFLLNAGADLNAVTSNGSALHVSIKTGLVSVFCRLLDAGADFNAKLRISTFFWGRDQPLFPQRRALDTAARFGRLDMVDILIRKGGESARRVHSPYDGAIELANEMRHYEIAKLLQVKAIERAGMAMFPVIEQFS